jgi:hypothetical protein
MHELAREGYKRSRLKGAQFEEQGVEFGGGRGREWYLYHNTFPFIICLLLPIYYSLVLIASKELSNTLSEILPTSLSFSLIVWYNQKRLLRKTDR